MPEKLGKNGEAFLGAAAIVTAFVVMLIAAYDVTGAIGFTPVHMPFEKHLMTQVWLPQGWKFFTRNPREDVQTVLIQDSKGIWNPVSQGVNSRPSNWFGMNRKNRAQGVEIGRLLQTVPKAAWLPTQGDPIEALEKCAIVMVVKNETPHPNILGTIGVIEQPPVPWAWFSRNTKALMPSKVIKIEVR